MRILLATRNSGKVREIREMTAGRDIEWLSLTDSPSLPEPAENGATFAENARDKAIYYAGHTALPALAEDSGLEVDALAGAPGVYSARFSGEPRDDARNNQKLLELLSGKPAPQRTARFISAMALADATGQIHLEASGSVEGWIVEEPRGSGGFGYDPLFFVPELGRTSAELSPAEKNRISHRGVALRQILGLLDTFRADLEPLFSEVQRA
jgi:XTP/dITP diphosphohydrolase